MVLTQKDQGKNKDGTPSKIRREKRPYQQMYMYTSLNGIHP